MTYESREPHVIVISEEREKALRFPEGSRQRFSAMLWVDWLTHRHNRQQGGEQAKPGYTQDDAPVISYGQLVERALELRTAPHHTTDVLTLQWWRSMGRHCTEQTVVLRRPPADH